MNTSGKIIISRLLPCDSLELVRLPFAYDTHFLHDLSIMILAVGPIGPLFICYHSRFAS